MRAFVCEVDDSGIRRLLPDGLLAADELGRLARHPTPRPTTVIQVLLNDPDAEELRAEVDARRHYSAYTLLLNRAVELISIDAALPSARP